MHLQPGALYYPDISWACWFRVAVYLPPFPAIFIIFYCRAEELNFASPRDPFEKGLVGGVLAELTEDDVRVPIDMIRIQQQ